MDSRRPVSAARKYGGDMYGGRSSYSKSKELPVKSDEDDVHDSLSVVCLNALYVPCHHKYIN